MEGKILVTGGLGFIGSHIVNGLGRSPENEILVFDICAKGAKTGNAMTIRGDIFDLDQLVRVMRDQDVTKVIHMIGLASIPDCRKNSNASFRLNVLSVHNMLEAMRLSYAERMIFPSTAAVYGVASDPKVGEEAMPKPVNVYGCHKLAAESLIRGYVEDYGFKTTVLRLFNVYGDIEKEQGVVSLFIRRALAGRPIIVKGGEQLRDFVHLRDVVKAFVESIDNPATHQKIINIGSGIGVSIKEVAGMIQQSFPQVEIKYEPLERGEYSIYADITRMKNLLTFDTIDPRKGIPTFIEKCKQTRKDQ
jgi:UDP-glucose 4-epimerase